MKTINLLYLLTVVFFTTSCQSGTNTNEETESSESESSMIIDDSDINDLEIANADSKPLIITLEPKSDSDLSGTATFTQMGDKVHLTATIKGLSEGMHAIHIHETGDCSAADAKSAGGHWNPTNSPHGEWGSPDGYHLGDIGNFMVDANGVGTVDFTTNEWCLGCNEPQKDIIGKSLMVHEGKDDFTSQPSGAAGARVGCGVIER